jgi:hypothetical protein
MPEQPNPFEIVEQLNRAMYGDKATRSTGLFDKIDALAEKLDRTDEKLEKIESRKHDPLSWTIGYVTFLFAGIFAVIAVSSLIPRYAILNLPPELSASLAVIGALVALYFFLTGYGWIGSK